MSKISSLFKDDRTRLAQLDPRTKILLTITVSTILISSGSSQSILRITITLCSLSLLLSIYKYLAFKVYNVVRDTDAFTSLCCAVYTWYAAVYLVGLRRHIYEYVAWFHCRLFYIIFN